MTGSSPVPPPASPSSPSSPAEHSRTSGRRPTRGASRAVAATVAALGALLLAGSCASAVASTVDSALRTDELLSAPTAGVSALDVDVTGAGVRVVAGVGPEAELDVRGTRGTWRLERDGSTLVVASPPPRTELLTFGGEGRATLVLPAALLDGTLEADVDLTGGSLEVEGDVDALHLSVTGGSVELAGAVGELQAGVTGGSFEARLTDVTSADVRLTAGSLDAVLDGTPPDAVAVDVTAGSVDLALPPADYDVRADASAGSVENGLRSSSAATRTVDVTTSAGSAVLREVAP